MVLQDATRHYAFSIAYKDLYMKLKIAAQELLLMYIWIYSSNFHKDIGGDRHRISCVFSIVLTRHQCLNSPFLRPKGNYLTSVAGICFFSSLLHVTYLPRKAVYWNGRVLLQT
ncbi:hypothetical protein GALMADRAFT_1217329 [Galerina marginata CBS 339.88]|uniref:Uncharacterized protein n=1 Tax=Galerina marginata (strain CBS 339.88) TaxID=685588 RepID=A0A067S7I5_GALM3|nr:hypothetical protein GALMADRAFT_1217329 [Galerina marginata CBS 339.88]